MNKEMILKVLNLPFCHKIKDLNQQTGLSINVIKELLDELINDKQVYFKDNMYYIRKQGKIQVKDRGFGFISVEGEESDYYVNEHDTKMAFNNDIVDFYTQRVDDGRHLTIAKVISIVQRANTNVIGKVVIKRKKDRISYYVASHDKAFNVKAHIKADELNGAVEGSIVKALVTKYINKENVEAKIVEIIGHCDDPGIDISEIAIKFGFETKFSDEAMDFTNKVPEEVNLSDFPNREDYTNVTTITIDGDDSKDFDDAVSLKMLDNGNYELGVYIADVSYYVTEGSPLDLEALERGTSVYLADRVIPMLPHKLSNGICSLNEGVNRLVMACIMEIDDKGNLINYTINEGIIKSTHRMTYNKVNRILKGDSALISEYSDIYEMILQMATLSDIIRERREKRGGIEFDVAEYKIELDEKGKAKNIILRTRDKAEMLIEDFMLQANETVAYHMNIMQLPCVYRVHENPDNEKVIKVFDMIKNLGYQIKTNPTKIYAKTVQQAMTLVKGSQEFLIINQMMLRSMMKAKYDKKCLGHFGLAMQYYCHFTSPIRRYPDLMTHRLIRECLLNPDNLADKLNHYEEIIGSICNQSSIQERKSIECEREVNDMLMAEYMVKYVKYQFTGIVTSVLAFGMFVTLGNGIEGLVHISDMNGYFNYNEKELSLSDGKNTYTIGDSVDVVCINASKKERKVDFMLKNDVINYFGEWFIKNENSSDK